MKIMHIVGNRPQFIKLAPVSQEVRKRGHEEIIIHTGQHFDINMSDVFFEELGIPSPTENLHVSGGTHSEMTANIMIALEPCVKKYSPDIVILYGDTNSTLAAALVVRKLGIPIVHVEAGPRTGGINNPEEINRVIVDRISDILCAPDESSKDNLGREGLGEKSFFTGDVMYDAFLNNCNKADFGKLASELDIENNKYILMTWHREENTSCVERMEWILQFLEQIELPVVFPMHPRTKKKLEEYGLLERLQSLENIKLSEPLGYLEMVALISHCSLVLTDSGGLSKEAFFANRKCLFMVELQVWAVLEENGWIVHLKDSIPENIRILNELMHSNGNVEEKKPLYYGNGRNAAVILDIIEEKYSKEGNRI